MVDSAAMAWDESIKDRYKNVDQLIDKGYDQWQRELSRKPRSLEQSHSSSPAPSQGRLLISRDGADVYLFRMTLKRGGNILQKTFFFLVEENLTTLSNQKLRSITPWLLIMQTSIASHIRPKTGSRKTEFVQMIKNGGDTIAAWVSQYPGIKNLYTVRYDIFAREPND